MVKYTYHFRVSMIIITKEEKFMTIGAKIWLWILLLSNVTGLFYLFSNDAEIILIIQMFLNIVAISLMLFLKMRAGFFLLCILALADLFFNLRFLSVLGVGLFLPIIIGLVLRIGITWLCLKNSWQEMK